MLFDLGKSVILRAVKRKRAWKLCIASRPVAYEGAPYRIRTYDLEIRSLLLYPAELTARAALIIDEKRSSLNGCVATSRIRMRLDSYGPFLVVCAGHVTI